MPGKTLEQLASEKEAAQKQLKLAEHKEKAYAAEYKKLTRTERTHRLCTRGAMLEHYILKPGLLTDGDVAAILTAAFALDPVQDKLEELLEQRRKEKQHEALQGDESRRKHSYDCR